MLGGFSRNLLNETDTGEAINPDEGRWFSSLEAAQPGPAINLRAMPCGGNGEANRRALVNEKPWTYKTGPRYACCCDDIGLGGRYEPETILV